jgi:hypothetical protein
MKTSTSAPTIAAQPVAPAFSPTDGLTPIKASCAFVAGTKPTTEGWMPTTVVLPAVVADAPTTLTLNSPAILGPVQPAPSAISTSQPIVKALEKSVM